MCFIKNAHPQSWQYPEVKPKQAHQIIVPDQSNDQYKSTDKSDDDDDDDFMIAFQLHAQPQKNVDSQNATTSNTQKFLYTNILYRLQPYHKHNKYLCVHLDTCADVNLMPKSIYKLVFNDPHTSKVTMNGIDLAVYMRHSVDLIGKCVFFMLRKDTKKLLK